MNLEPLRSLQKRIREATGPDRDLDEEICLAFLPNEQFRVGEMPYFTTDPDGLGACVALQSEVLPGHRKDSFQRVDHFSLFVTAPSGDHQNASHFLETHAHLLAIFAAVIAREEAKETEKTA